MSDMPLEILVVDARPHPSRPLADRLRATATVTAAMPPRLLLVRPGESALPVLDGVRYLTADQPAPPGLEADLSAEERLFVEAWRSRAAPKQRRGEGLAWDSPGFTPPDPPTGHRP